MEDKNKPVKLRFSRENMWTVSGFVYDSFESHQAEFVDLLGEAVYGAEFLRKFDAARQKIKGVTGAGLRIGTTAQVTTRLYGNMDAVKPLLDRIEARLRLIPAKDLTVAPKDFRLKQLRDRINARDAEATGRELVKLVKLIGDNRDALDGKGYKEQELLDLVDLQGKIDDDNRLQNSGMNTSQEATVLDDADYKAVDDVLGQIMGTARLLYKNNKTRRKQYEQPALQARVEAGEKPKPRGGDAE